MPATHRMHADRPLTGIILQQGQPGAYVGHHALPLVGVRHQSDTLWQETDGAAYTTAPASGKRLFSRAPGGSYDRIDYDVSETSAYRCVNYGIEAPIPDEERDNADEPLDPERSKGQLLLRQLRNAQEQRYASLLFDYASTFSAYTATPTTEWQEDTADPQGDTLGWIENIKLEGRYDPASNKLVAIMGAKSWRKVQGNPAILDRLKYTQTVTNISRDSFRQYIGGDDLEELYIGDALYNTSRDGQSVSLDYIWGEHIGIYSVPRSPTTHAGPAVGFSFVWTTTDLGGASVDDHGLMYMSYRDDGRRADILRADHYIDELVLQPSAGFVGNTITS